MKISRLATIVTPTAFSSPLADKRAGPNSPQANRIFENPVARRSKPRRVVSVSIITSGVTLPRFTSGPNVFTKKLLPE